MRKGFLPTTPTFFDGLFIATNAVPDACIVLDCPNCGCDKPGKTGVNHDLESSLLSRNGHRADYSTLQANDLVMGTEEKLRAKVMETVEKRRPAIVLIAQSSAVLLMGQDIEATAAELEAETGVPVVAVPSNTLSGDYLDGYGAAVEALARKAPLDVSRRRPGSVAIVGHFMDRMEEDQQSNLRELRRICGALSIPVASVWLSGRVYADLLSVSDADRILTFGYGAGAGAALAARLGCELTECAPPIGLDGAARWTRSLAGLFDRGKEAGDFISRELDEAVPRLEWVVRREFVNRNAAIAADPFIAPGLISFLSELGMNIRSVVLRTRRQSAAGPVTAALESAGQSAGIIVDPAYPEVEEEWSGLRSKEKLDFILATGNERDIAKPLGVPFLELGYPSYVRHALFDAPWLGFRGAVWLADAMFNLFADWEYRRY